MHAPQPDLTRLIRASRDPAALVSHQEFSRRVRSGDYERLRRGVAREAPVPLSSVDRFDRVAHARLRYLDVVAAVGETRRGQVVFAGQAALAIWDLATIGSRPTSVEILEPPGSARRSKRGVIVHRMPFMDDEILPWGDHFVTSPARTIADLARSGDFTATVVALDHALSRRATSEQRVSKDEVYELLDRYASTRGLARARAAVEFADGRSGSGGESLSRVDIYQLGFELPELQVRHSHPGGYYDADFEWPATAQRPPTIGEFDGLMKYLDARLRNGADAAQVVVAEKVREDFLRAEGNGFLRWGWEEARKPVLLLRPRLLRAGIRIVRRPMI
ncbi:hypothetical protein GCM10022286_13340 [Gryllotalpicola daejeonensis]|uniref:Transcriptional regulator, AbiEi antitoxin, Type IV TA system n=1 Tax=Gryllotalpicola daejeonensis TaxID=993087 RepID=A0ABP7ZIT7_9MICO